jgi:gluconolactonase
VGDGEHNSRHATELFPEVLRWLWRDYPAPIKANPDGKSRQDVFQVLLPGEDWQVVSEGHRNTDGPAVNGKGEMFFSDPANSRIYRIGLDGKVHLFAEQTNGANGMMFGPDGRLYVGATRTRQIVAYGESGGTPEVLAEDVATNDLAVNATGDLYFTDTPGKKIWLLPRGGKPRVVDEGIESPNGVVFSPDQSLLYVSDYVGQLSWVLQIQPDGSLARKQLYFYVHMPDAALRSCADGMAVDAEGRVYIATALGATSIRASRPDTSGRDSIGQRGNTVGLGRREPDSPTLGGEPGEDLAKESCLKAPLRQACAPDDRFS